uniref:Sodefrin-like factor n=1 Tax=Eurycea guttolineata TaxID=332576 RepID=Q4FAC8_9SALA|nr:sodefrin precursor-like factor [Eurycea guttolineata]
MNAFLTGVIFLVAFTATGNCLQCYECAGIGTDCPGELISCNDGVTTCETITIETKQDDTTTTQVVKVCSGKEEETSTYREKSLTTYFQLQTHNCDTDGCNQGPAPHNPPDNTPNGVKCMQCFNENGSDCNSDEIVECTEDMKKCLFISTFGCIDDSTPCSYRLCTNIDSPEQHPFYYQIAEKTVETIEIYDGI